MTNRILIGDFPAGDNSPAGKGIRVSQPGYDVMTPNPDNEKLHFNSDWPEVLPLHQRGLVYVPANTLTTVMFPNLGYIPFMSALINIGKTASAAGRGWEQYATANSIMSIGRKNNLGGDTINNSQLNVYASYGNRYQNIWFNTLADRITIYSGSNPMAAYYFIYRVKAF